RRLPGSGPLRHGGCGLFPDRLVLAPEGDVRRRRPAARADRDHEHHRWSHRLSQPGHRGHHSLREGAAGKALCLTFPGPRAKSPPGGVAEWSKAAVLKTAVPKGTRGSNPFASAEWRATTSRDDVAEHSELCDLYDLRGRGPQSSGGSLPQIRTP